MRLVARPLLTTVRFRPARMALMALAIFASSCVAVWVVSRYDALLGQLIDENAARAPGRFDRIVSGGAGAGMARYLGPFGGLDTPLVIPWRRLAPGIGSTPGLGLPAARWPAVAAGRAEPLEFLQAGRASA